MGYIKLKREIVFEQSSDELYSKHLEAFATEEELEVWREDYELDVVIDIDTDSEAEDIPIEEMKALIQRAEDAGANFISIDYHCDHIEYDIYGSKISRLSGSDSKKIDDAKKLKKEDEKQRKIDYLRRELAKLEDE